LNSTQEHQSMAKSLKFQWRCRSAPITPRSRNRLPLSSASLDRLTDIFLHASQRFGPGQQAQYTSLDCGTGGLHPVPPSRRKWATPPYLRETSAFNYVSVPVRRPPPMHRSSLSHARRASSLDPFPTGKRAAHRSILVRAR
jgi:hypothetical protein